MKYIPIIYIIPWIGSNSPNWLVKAACAGPSSTHIFSAPVGIIVLEAVCFHTLITLHNINILLSDPFSVRSLFHRSELLVHFLQLIIVVFSVSVIPSCEHSVFPAGCKVFHFQRISFCFKECGKNHRETSMTPQLAPLLKHHSVQFIRDSSTSLYGVTADSKAFTMLFQSARHWQPVISHGRGCRGSKQEIYLSGWGLVVHTMITKFFQRWLRYNADRCKIIWSRETWSKQVSFQSI